MTDFRVTEYTVRVRHDAGTEPPTDAVSDFCEALLTADDITGVEAQEGRAIVTEMGP